jgi:hypothetical protein
METDRFYLGTHEPQWLHRLEDVPLFISYRRLLRYRSRELPIARTRWALDSGAFSELAKYGEWRTTENQYVHDALVYREEMGRPDWIAPMDWMCEPFMLEKTGRTIREHQALTTGNLLALRGKAADLPFIPVLQGWRVKDYLRHWEMYEAAGIHLEDESTVGVGSVCRRQGTGEAAAIFASLSGLRLHGFGVKLSGLSRFGGFLTSCDSLAWSYEAVQRGRRIVGHPHRHCGNCMDYALMWRERVVKRLEDQNGYRTNGGT